MCINKGSASTQSRSGRPGSRVRAVPLGLALAGLAWLAPFGPAALGHHSAAMFDDQVVLTLQGTVTRFDYVNPHSWLYVNIENEDGTATEWGFELDAPPRLRRLGVSPSFWEGGDRVVVKTNPLKDGRPAGHLVGAITKDGRTFGNASGVSAPE